MVDIIHKKREGGELTEQEKGLANIFASAFPKGRSPITRPPPF